MTGDPKGELHAYLRGAREALVWKLDGLDEHDIRRPLTPTGTNLLGLVKHSAGTHRRYFGEVFGRPFDLSPPWPVDHPEPNAEHWAAPDESRDDVIARCHRAWERADVTIAELPLDAVGRVPWWGGESVTLHHVLVHVTAETQRHAGHADIVRELVDGSAGLLEAHGNLPATDPAWWTDHHARVEAAARTASGEGRRFAPRPGGWRDEGQVAEFLDRMTADHPRVAGEEVLVSALPPRPVGVLDLGAGDGRLGALVAAARPTIERVVLVDSSPAMLDRARSRLADGRVEVHAHDLEDPIGGFGRFDVVVSGMAIHHLPDERKRSLFREVADVLEPGGLFADLEVVQSPTPELHRAFLDALGREADDPEDRLVDVGTQLAWLGDAGFTQVDCLWRWRGLALLVATNPA